MRKLPEVPYKHVEKLKLNHKTIDLPMIDYYKGREAPASSGPAYVKATQRLLDGKISENEWRSIINQL